MATLSSESSLTLILGGTRSGKSQFAESLVESWHRPLADKRPLIYIATAQPFSTEMHTRIEKHHSRRGADWQTVEAPIHLADTLIRHTHRGDIVLVDCVSVWLGNLFHHEVDIDAEVTGFLEYLSRQESTVVVVGVETGLGIVPENALARAFCDEAGLLNQRLAAIAERVYLVVAGIPLTLKATN